MAIVVRLLGAAAARDRLGMTFPGVEPEMGVMLSVLANNTRVLVGVLAACVVAQVACHRERRGAIERLAVWGCDLAIVGAAAFHALLIGAGVGAYGTRMVVGLLPHGPLELATFSLALGLYCTARRERVTPRRALAVAAVCVLGLAASAALEVFGLPTD